MSDKAKKLIVLFPGAGYSNDMPLLYYADFKYEAMGYECVKINYGSGERKTLNDIENIKKVILNQTERIDFSQYSDILFISKSLGTIFSGWLSETLNIKVRHIYLTPLQSTLQYIKGHDIQIVIAGTKDKYMDTSILIQHCEKENIKLELIENAGHGLEIIGDMNVNIDNLKRIVDLY